MQPFFNIFVPLYLCAFVPFLPLSHQDTSFTKNICGLKLAIIDNWDSFTFNLVQLVEEAGYEVDAIYKNNSIRMDDLTAYDKILISPGPGLPSEAGSLIEVIQTYASEKSILGICLGHQAIAEVFGCKLKQLTKILHGEQTRIHVIDKQEPLFSGLPEYFNGGRYHSWIVDSDSLTDTIKVTAIDDENLIMAISHAEYDVRGIQFHPESFMTKQGQRIISNWLVQ